MARSRRNLSPLLSPLAALAAAMSPSRAGATLAGAPGVGEPEAHSVSRSLLRRSLRACTSEGLVAEIVNACAGSAILTGWAIHLHAGALLTGVVVALPQMAQLLQIPAAWTTSWLGHRRAAVALVAASRQVMLPLVALALLPVSERTGQTILFTVAAVAAVLGILGNNAWVSWMGELVPSRIRGRYFGRRTALCTIGGASASAAVGLLLDWARPRGLTGAVLATLQVCASLSGIAAALLMLRQHDPSHGSERPTPSLAKALAPFRDKQVRGLLRYVVTWNLAVGMAGSFFALHMLKNLRMGFALVALHGTALAAARVMTAPLWGRLIDRLGARPVLIACAFGVSTVPLIWLFPTPTFLWPLVLDAILAGALWGGHNLAMFVLPLTATPRRGRPFYIAAIATAGGFTFSVATACGGALAQLLPERSVLAGHTFHNLQVLFAISAVMRFGAAFAAFRIHEPQAAGVGALLTAVMGRPTKRPALVPAPADGSIAA